jgi:protein-S-isoprenylcysteine O-methyltransferase Ste14
MIPAAAVRALVLYLPMATAGAAWALRRPGPRERAGVVLALAWTLVTVPAVHAMALHAGWWRFEARGGTFVGMPVEAYLGWVLLWGAVLPLAAGRLHPAVGVMAALWMDALLMPLCAPLLQLGPRWLLGEGMALGVCLLPALLLARWTACDRRLPWRAAMQAALAGGLVMWLVPAAAFAQVGGGWDALLARPLATTLTLAQVLALAALPGLSAAQEFATRGGGTPIPFDPPRRLVRSGAYAYVANPMQISAAAVLAVWGWMLGSAWVAAGGAVAVAYSVGLAAWDEGADLHERFGGAWAAYRQAVRPWLPRLRPWHPADEPPARLYVSAGCGPCSQVGWWIDGRRPAGLVVVPAERHPSRDLRRITYHAGGGAAEEEGVAALARALEHVHLGWALLGMALRLPVVLQVMQVLVDASGGGPRTVARWPAGSTELQAAAASGCAAVASTGNYETGE